MLLSIQSAADSATWRASPAEMARSPISPANCAMAVGLAASTGSAFGSAPAPPVARLLRLKQSPPSVTVSVADPTGNGSGSGTPDQPVSTVRSAADTSGPMRMTASRSAASPNARA